MIVQRLHENNVVQSSWSASWFNSRLLVRLRPDQSDRLLRPCSILCIMRVSLLYNTAMLGCFNTIFIDINATHSDLGIVFDDQLKFHHHTTQVTTKANRVLGLIKKSFEYLDSTMLTCLFNTLVRPILEYNNPIWGPHYILDNRKVEKIQRRATRLIPQLQDKSYSEIDTTRFAIFSL